ncbi:MAG: DUF4214 domain-containing protein [Rhizobiaceae bacterium]|nr:DUF4214 domain-containing protein [Rhizobiaceae bacterium]
MAEFTGTSGIDPLTGTSDDDIFEKLGSGADTIDGYAGNDVVSYLQDGGEIGVAVTVGAGGNGAAVDTFGDTDTLISIEGFIGTEFDDRFEFGDGANFFVEGHLGADTFELEAIEYGTISYRFLINDQIIDFLNSVVGGVDIVGVHLDFAEGTVTKYNGEEDSFTQVDELEFRGTGTSDRLEGADDELTTYLEGMGGDDTLVGGDSFDYAKFRAEGDVIGAGFTVDLTEGTATNAVNDDVDTLIGIRNVEGSDFDDVIIGDDEWNYFVGRGGDDEFSGGSGVDTVAYWGHVRDDVSITGIGSDTVTVEDIEGDWGTDMLDGIEAIAFDDGILRLDIDGAAGQVYRLYQAAYVREPDSAGLEFYIGAVDRGTITLPDLADQFVQADEFIENYGEDLTDEELIDIIYNNVLGRDADEGGKAFWTEQLAKPDVDAGDLLYFFSESEENVDLVAPAIEDGIWLA